MLDRHRKNKVFLFRKAGFWLDRKIIQSCRQEREMENHHDGRRRRRRRPHHDGPSSHLVVTTVAAVVVIGAIGAIAWSIWSDYGSSNGGDCNRRNDESNSTAAAANEHKNTLSTQGINNEAKKLMKTEKTITSSTPLPHNVIEDRKNDLDSLTCHTKGKEISINISDTNQKAAYISNSEKVDKDKVGDDTVEATTRDVHRHLKRFPSVVTIAGVIKNMDDDTLQMSPNSKVRSIQKQSDFYSVEDSTSHTVEDTTTSTFSDVCTSLTMENIEQVQQPILKKRHGRRVFGLRVTNTYSI